MSRLKLFALLALPLFLGGCLVTESPEELERLTKEDASFEKMILARNQAHSQIELIKKDLLDHKSALNVQAEKLRAEYDAYSKTQRQKMDQFRSLVDNNRQLLKNQIDAAQTHLDAKQVEAEGYQKTLADVQRMLKESKGIQLSAKERQKWDERTLMLSEKIRPLEDEIRELKLEIRLKNQKIRYLH